MEIQMVTMGGDSLSREARLSLERAWTKMALISFWIIITRFIAMKITNNIFRYTRIQLCISCISSCIGLYRLALNGRAREKNSRRMDEWGMDEWRIDEWGIRNSSLQLRPPMPFLHSPSSFCAFLQEVGRRWAVRGPITYLQPPTSNLIPKGF